MGKDKFDSVYLYGMKERLKNIMNEFPQHIAGVHMEDSFNAILKAYEEVHKWLWDTAAREKINDIELSLEDEKDGDDGEHVDKVECIDECGIPLASVGLKMLSLCALLIGFSSCKPAEPTPNDRATSIVEDRVPFDKVIEFKYKKHKYIKFVDYNGLGDCSTEHAGVVDDPDCEECKHNREIEYWKIRNGI